MSVFLTQPIEQAPIPNHLIEEILRRWRNEPPQRGFPYFPSVNVFISSASFYFGAGWSEWGVELAWLLFYPQSGTDEDYTVYFSLGRGAVCTGRGGTWVSLHCTSSREKFDMKSRKISSSREFVFTSDSLEFWNLPVFCLVFLPCLDYRSGSLTINQYTVTTPLSEAHTHSARKKKGDPSKARSRDESISADVDFLFSCRACPITTGESLLLISAMNCATLTRLSWWFRIVPQMMISGELQLLDPEIEFQWVLQLMFSVRSAFSSVRTVVK